MADKILAKDAAINSIYLTRGGKQKTVDGKVCLWGFHPVRVSSMKLIDDKVAKVVVFTPWKTELLLNPDYPLEITDLQTLPAVSTPIMIKAEKISSDDEAPAEYVKKLKSAKREEQVQEDPQKDNKAKIFEELKEGTPTKQIVEKIKGMDYRAVYGYINQLEKDLAKEGVYRLLKLKKGVFKIEEREK